MTRSHVTTHVLDAVRGRPAVGIEVTLTGPDGSDAALATGTTDTDGRIPDLGPARLSPGVYRLRFDVGRWFEALGEAAFYPEVVVAFTVSDGEHRHVPLLLGPWSYTTYRGS